MVFFEPTSPYFLNTLVISAVLLFVAVVFGLFYQAFCYKKLCGETGDQGMLNSLLAMKIFIKWGLINLAA